MKYSLIYLVDKLLKVFIIKCSLQLHDIYKSSLLIYSILLQVFFSALLITALVPLNYDTGLKSE